MPQVYQLPLRVLAAQGRALAWAPETAQLPAACGPRWREGTAWGTPCLDRAMAALAKRGSCL